MRPSGYHHNDFVANHALGHDKAIMLITGGDIVFTIKHLAYVRFEHSVCRESLMTTYVYICLYNIQRDLTDLISYIYSGWKNNMK